jgi:hypothetical protein
MVNVIENDKADSSSKWSGAQAMQLVPSVLDENGQGAA